MRAKFYCISAMAVMSLSGCETAKRLAPPGFVKYEDIAQDKPINPEIAQRIAERKSGDEARFPVLSRTPQVRPARSPAIEREISRDTLIEARDAANANAAKDRTSAARRDGQREALERRRDALAREAAAIRQAVREEAAAAPADKSDQN